MRRGGRTQDRCSSEPAQKGGESEFVGEGFARTAVLLPQEKESSSIRVLLKRLTGKVNEVCADDVATCSIVITSKADQLPLPKMGAGNVILQSTPISQQDESDRIINLPQLVQLFARAKFKKNAPLLNGAYVNIT